MRRDTAALVAFIDSRMNTPHEWGRDKNDCVSFALDAAEAQTGIKPAPELKWSNEKQAAKVIKRFGSVKPRIRTGGLEKAFDHYFRRISPAQAMRGDIGAVPDEDFGIHPMVVEGLTLVGPGERGNKRVKRTAMVAAWSILPDGG